MSGSPSVDPHLQELLQGYTDAEAHWLTKLQNVAVEIAATQAKPAFAG
jgi:hypothetical protein